MNHESTIAISPPCSHTPPIEHRDMGTRHIRYDSWLTRAASVTIVVALLGAPACLQAAEGGKPATDDKAGKGKPIVVPVKERREPPRDIDDPDPPPPDIGPVVPELRVDRNTSKQDKHRHKERSLGKVAPEHIESHPQREIHVLVSEKEGKEDRIKKGERGR